MCPLEIHNRHEVKHPEPHCAQLSRKAALLINRKTLFQAPFGTLCILPRLEVGMKTHDRTQSPICKLKIAQATRLELPSPSKRVPFSVKFLFISTFLTSTDTPSSSFDVFLCGWRVFFTHQLWGITCYPGHEMIKLSAHCTDRLSIHVCVCNVFGYFDCKAWTC